MFDENIHDILRIFTKPRPAGTVPLDPHAVLKHLTTSLALTYSYFENYKLALLYLKDLLIVKPQVSFSSVAQQPFRDKSLSVILVDCCCARVIIILLQARKRLRSRVSASPDEASPAEVDRSLHKELIDMYLFSIDDLIRQQEKQQGKSKEVCLAKDDKGLVRGYRLELIQILKTSKYYSPNDVLQNFPKEKLLEEFAVLLGCLGLYDRAIHIYINNLKKPDAAEDYCNDLYVREECKG